VTDRARSLTIARSARALFVSMASVDSYQAWFALTHAASRESAK
jgi:hypothetical protein